jgi:hypothetical protein
MCNRSISGIRPVSCLSIHLPRRPSHSANNFDSLARRVAALLSNLLFTISKPLFADEWAGATLNQLLYQLVAADTFRSRVMQKYDYDDLSYDDEQNEDVHNTPVCWLTPDILSNPRDHRVGGLTSCTRCNCEMPVEQQLQASTCWQ